MEFAWNEIQAEDIRQASVQAMKRTTDDMRATARRFTTEATDLREQITALRATLPIMTTITREIRIKNSDGEWETHFETHEVQDMAASARVQAQIATLQKRVDDLMQAASILNKAADTLEAEILATNKLLEQLQAKIQSTDYVYAGKIAALKAQIENQLARIGDIRDSFGNKFTTEACGIVYFGSSAGSILNNPTNFPYQWDAFGRILQRPAEQITDAQFLSLAWFFTQQTTIQGQERFLNLFLEPVTSPTLPRPFDVNAFSICPQKVGGVLGVFGDGIRAIFNEQMGLSTGSERYGALQREGDHLKDLSALLSVIYGLACSGTVGGTGINQLTNVHQNVVLAIGNDTPITITQNTQGTTVTFNRGEVHGHSHNSEGTNPFWVNIRPADATMLWNGSLNSTSKTISNVYGGAGLNVELSYALGSHFRDQHQFNMGTFIAGQAASFGLGLATAGLGTVASTAVGFVTSMSSARSGARNIQNDFITITTGEAFGRFQNDFAFRGVVITSTERPPQVMSWPTAYTRASIDALNSVLIDNHDNLEDISRNPDVITQPFFTWTQFLQDPNRVFRAYATLRGDGIDLLVPLINANRTARNYQIENPEPQPLSQPPPDYLHPEVN